MGLGSNCSFSDVIRSSGPRAFTYVRSRNLHETNKCFLCLDRITACMQFYLASMIWIKLLNCKRALFGFHVCLCGLKTLRGGGADAEVTMFECDQLQRSFAFCFLIFSFSSPFLPVWRELETMIKSNSKSIFSAKGVQLALTLQEPHLNYLFSAHYRWAISWVLWSFIQNIMTHHWLCMQCIRVFSTKCLNSQNGWSHSKFLWDTLLIHTLSLSAWNLQKIWIIAIVFNWLNG